VELAQELGCRALVVDGTAVHDLGASDVQELGYVLALGAHYLRALEAAGIDVDDAVGLLEFRLAATADQFVTIAKMRAVRRMWARMLELSGASDNRRNMTLHVVTSRPMMTKYDPWVNMLRTCVAAFAAGVGGADAVTVLPFDARLGLPDAFSRRIARNTSTLLVAESHVANVADPAGGAFAVEKLTDDLALAGWEELGRIEASGGVLEALEDGSLRSRIDEVVSERDRQIATRKRPLTGLTEFPNLHETLPERTAYAEGALPVRPYGAAFEALRDDPAEAKVFLATMGTIAAHTARASFASNLFAAGGIGVVNTGRHDDLDAVLKDFTGPDGGQSVVCLVGNDKAYAAWGSELVAALREAGAQWVILAGKPVEGVDTDDTCAMGVDALRLRVRSLPRSPSQVRRGSRPRASASCRSTDPSTSRGWTRSTPIRGSRRSCAGPTRRCTPPSRGRSASTPDSPPPRSPTPSTAATSRPGRRASRSPSTSRPTVATTPTTRG
jgi:methylmalonyl-CoA mutase